MNITFVRKRNFQGGSMCFTPDEQKRIINKGNGLAKRIINKVLFVILFIVMFVVMIIHINKLAIFTYGTEYLSLLSHEKTSLLRFISITYIICIVIISPIHELIHLLSNIEKGAKQTFVVFALPFSINIIYDFWRTKTQTIKSYLSPFIVISIILITLYVLIENPMIQTILILSFFMNTIGSVYDIVNAVWFFTVSPKGSLIYQGFILPPPSASR